MTLISCPKCALKLQIPDRLHGKIVQCKCGHKLKTPEAAAVTKKEAVPEQSGPTKNTDSSDLFAELDLPTNNSDVTQFAFDPAKLKARQPSKRELASRNTEKPRQEEKKKTDGDVLASYLNGSTNTEEKVGLLNLRLHEMQKTEDEWGDAAPDSSGEAAAEGKMGFLRSSKGRFKGLSVNTKVESQHDNRNKIVLWSSVVAIALLVIGLLIFSSVKLYGYLTSLSAGSSSPHQQVVRNDENRISEDLAKSAARQPSIPTIVIHPPQASKKQYPISRFPTEADARQAFNSDVPTRTIQKIVQEQTYWFITI